MEFVEFFLFVFLGILNLWDWFLPGIFNRIPEVFFPCLFYQEFSVSGIFPCLFLSGI